MPFKVIKEVEAVNDNEIETEIGDVIEIMDIKEC